MTNTNILFSGHLYRCTPQQSWKHATKVKSKSAKWKPIPSLTWIKIIKSVTLATLLLEKLLDQNQVHQQVQHKHNDQHKHFIFRSFIQVYSPAELETCYKSKIKECEVETFSKFNLDQNHKRYHFGNFAVRKTLGLESGTSASTL